MKRLVRVAGESMAPTYRSSDLLLTRRGRTAGVPRRGDVVVFRHGGIRMIKRVAGVPDDRVELEAGRLFVNGESVDGRPRVPGAYTRTWRVPMGSYFVAGDNPAVSDDSRVWDEPFVPVDNVEAVVIATAVWGRRRPGLQTSSTSLLQPSGLRDRYRPPRRRSRSEPACSQALQGPAEAFRGGVEQGGHVLLGHGQGHRGNAAPPGAGYRAGSRPGGSRHRARSVELSRCSVSESRALTVASSRRPISGVLPDQALKIIVAEHAELAFVQRGGVVIGPLAREHRGLAGEIAWTQHPDELLGPVR